MNTTGSTPETTNVWNSLPLIPVTPARNVEPVVNAVGCTSQTTNNWSRRPEETLPPARNVKPAVNAAGSTPHTWNSPPEETLPSANNVEPAVNTTRSNTQTINIGSSEPGENAIINNQIHDSMALYSRSENTNAVNIPALPSYPQPASCLSPELPAEGQLVDAKSSMAEPYSPGEVFDLNDQPEDTFHLHTEPLTTKTHLESPQDHSERKNQPSENASVVHLPATNTTEITQPVMNAAVKKEMTTVGDFSEVNGGRKTSRVFRKSRRDPRERSAGDGIEPETKKPRLKATPKKDSQSNSQGPWQGKIYLKRTPGFQVVYDAFTPTENATETYQ